MFLSGASSKSEFGDEPKYEIDRGEAAEKDPDNGDGGLLRQMVDLGACVSGNGNERGVVVTNVAARQLG